MEISEFMKKKSVFGNKKTASAEVENMAEAPSVFETEPEVEVPPVTEVAPEVEAPSVSEIEPEAETPSESESGTESEQKEETPAVSEPEVKEVTESDAEECANISQNCITAEQMAAVLEDANKPVLSEISAINSSLKDINARVLSLRKLADMHQEIENNLNNQINEYKENLYRRIVNPILVEFFDFQEDMNSEAIGASEETAKILTEYVNIITNILKHYGVTVETVSVGDMYDTRIHKPAKVVQTDDKSLDRTIARTRKTLVHSIDGKIVERANVHVYQYQESKVQPTAEEPAETSSEPSAE